MGVGRLDGCALAILGEHVLLLRRGKRQHLLQRGRLDNMERLVVNRHLWLEPYLSDLLLCLGLPRSSLEDGPECVRSGLRLIPNLSQSLESPHPVGWVSLAVVELVLVLADMSLPVHSHAGKTSDQVVSWCIVASNLALQLVWTQGDGDVLAMLPLLSRLVQMSQVLEVDELSYQRCRLLRSDMSRTGGDPHLFPRLLYHLLLV